MRRAASLSAALLWIFVGIFAAGCGGSGEPDPAGAESGASSDPAAGPLLLVTNEDAGTLSIVATTTHEVLAEIEVGRRPRGVRASPDGGMAYVAVSGSPKCPPWMEEEGCAEPDKQFDGIAEVDLREQVRTRILPGGSDPETFDITPDGARIVVSNEDTDEASLVDLESGEIIRTVPVGAEPEGVRISPDGTLAYVTGETDHDVTVLDTSTGDEITRITVGHRPRDLVFTPDGTFAYVSSEIDGTVAEIIVAENRVSRTIALPEGSRSMGVALSRDARTLYVANGRSKTVSVVDLGSGEVTANVEVGGAALGNRALLRREPPLHGERAVERRDGAGYGDAGGGRAHPGGRVAVGAGTGSVAPAGGMARTPGTAGLQTGIANPTSEIARASRAR